MKRRMFLASLASSAGLLAIPSIARSEPTVIKGMVNVHTGQLHLGNMGQWSGLYTKFAVTATSLDDIAREVLERFPNTLWFSLQIRDHWNPYLTPDATWYKPQQELIARYNLAPNHKGWVMTTSTHHNAPATF